MKKTFLLTLCVWFGVIPALAQKADTVPLRVYPVIGTVFDDVTGEELPFVTVLIKGTTNGTLALSDGSFSITVPSLETVLVFSFVGYEKLEMPVKTGTRMSVRLKPSAVALDAVVITGMFERARESYTGAVTTVRSEELQTRRGQNLVQTLRNIDPAINMLENNLAGSNPMHCQTLPFGGVRRSLSMCRRLTRGSSTTSTCPLSLWTDLKSRSRN